MTLLLKGDFPRLEAVAARFMRCGDGREHGRPLRFAKHFPGSGSFSRGALRCLSRNRGRGWNRLRGGSRPVCRSRCAGRTTRSPAPHRRPESIRGWSATVAPRLSHREMTPWCALYGFEQRTFVRPLVRASDFFRSAPNQPSTQRRQPPSCSTSSTLSSPYCSGQSSAQ